MKNLINRALAAEKKLFILLAAVVMTASAMADQTLPRIYCGCVLGKTTYKDIFSGDSQLPKSEKMKDLLVASSVAGSFVGDFVVADHHFSILTMYFYKDTLYQMTFRDEEINNDIMELNRTFIRQYKEKYKSFNNWLRDDELNDEQFLTCSKTDSIVGISIMGSPHSLEFTIILERLANESLYSAFSTLYKNKEGSNYDEKNKVTSIAGVRFGESKQTVMNVFKKRGNFIKDEGNFSFFYDVSFGGSTFSTASLYFQYNSRRYDNVLTAAKFEKNFYDWKRDEALMMYESIVDLFKSKYTNCTIIKDEENRKLMVCGMLEDDYEEGKVPPIYVSFNLGISRGGEKFYYVSVYYFGTRMSSANKDDI